MSIAIIVSAFIGIIGYLLKYMISQKFEVMAKKREVYEEISTALGIFLTGRDITADDKKRFLEDYSKLWLWASDSVIQAGNEFMDIMIGFNASDEGSQKEAKRAYASFVIEMQRELGFPNTLLKSNEYRFVSFGH